MGWWEQWSQRRANIIFGSRNTILITLPNSSQLDPSAQDFNLGPQMTVVKIDSRRKSLLLRDVSRILDGEGKRAFDAEIEQPGWAIEIAYDEPFDLIDFMDSRRERIVNTIKTLLLLSTFEWQRVWHIHSYARRDQERRLERCVMAEKLRSGWSYDQDLFVHDKEVEFITLDRLARFKTYRRRLGAIHNHPTSPISTAVQLYWHHLALDSGYMRMICLFMALEALFNLGNQVTRTISNTVGRLLGRNPLEAQTITAQVFDLYNTRSGIVHGADRNRLTSVNKIAAGDFEQVFVLHDHTRRCIRHILDRPRLFEIFNDAGRRREFVISLNQ